MKTFARVALLVIVAYLANLRGRSQQAKADAAILHAAEKAVLQADQNWEELHNSIALPDETPTPQPVAQDLSL